MDGKKAPPAQRATAKKPAPSTALLPPDYLLSVKGLHTPEELRQLATLCEEGQLLIDRSLQEPLPPTVRAARKWILALTAPGRNPETSIPLRSLCSPDRWSFLRALASLQGSSPERVWPRGFRFRRLGLPDLTFRRRKRRGRPRGTRASRRAKEKSPAAMLAAATKDRKQLARVALLYAELERCGLTKRQAEVFRLRFVGMKPSAIAKQLGITPQAVSGLEQRARDNLQKKHTSSQVQRWLFHLLRSRNELD